MSESKLDQFKTSHRGGTGCRICGDTHTTAAINVGLREFGRAHQIRGGSMIASRQVSLCESCAVALWPKVRELLP